MLNKMGLTACGFALRPRETNQLGCERVAKVGLVSLISRFVAAWSVTQIVSIQDFECILLNQAEGSDWPDFQPRIHCKKLFFL